MILPIYVSNTSITILFLALFIPHANGYGGYHQCKTDCTYEERNDLFFGDCCCLDCDDEGDYAQEDVNPRFCCAYQNLFLLAWYFYIFVGVGAMLNFFQSAKFWWNGLGKIKAVSERVSKANSTDESSIKAAHDFPRATLVAMHTKLRHDDDGGGMLVCDHFAEIQLEEDHNNSSRTTVLLTQCGYRDLYEYQGRYMDPTIAEPPTNISSSSRRGTNRFPGFELAFDKGALFLLRDAGTHAGMMEGLILGGIMSLISNSWVSYMVTLKGEYILIAVLDVLFFLMAISCFPSNKIVSMPLCMGCSRERDIVVEEEGSYPRVYHCFGKKAARPVGGALSGNYYVLHAID